MPGGERSRALRAPRRPAHAGRHARWPPTSPAAAPTTRAPRSRRRAARAIVVPLAGGEPDAGRPGRRGVAARLERGGPHHAGHARPPGGGGPHQGRRAPGGGPARGPARAPRRRLRDRGQHPGRGRPAGRDRALRAALVRLLQRVRLPGAAGGARGASWRGAAGAPPPRCPRDTAWPFGGGIIGWVAEHGAAHPGQRRAPRAALRAVRARAPPCPSWRCPCG